MISVFIIIHQAREWLSISIHHHVIGSIRLIILINLVNQRRRHRRCRCLSIYPIECIRCSTLKTSNKEPFTVTVEVICNLWHCLIIWIIIHYCQTAAFCLTECIGFRPSHRIVITIVCFPLRRCLCSRGDFIHLNLQHKTHRIRSRICSVVPSTTHSVNASKSFLTVTVSQMVWFPRPPIGIFHTLSICGTIRKISSIWILCSIS